MMKFILLFIFIIGCGGKEYKREQGQVVISANSDRNSSSTAGNLVTTALKEVHELDMVLYPKTLMKGGEVSILDPKNRTLDIQQTLAIFPEGTKDRFYIGNMRGRDIKHLLRARTLETYDAELEVAGLKYVFRFRGGFPMGSSFAIDEQPMDDERVFRVAISKFYWFSGETFPSYKFRNSIERIFRNTFLEISARESLKEFLKSDKKIPLLDRKRAEVRHIDMGDFGTKTIAQIQGQTHLSPFFGGRVQTKGIVTAIAPLDWYPGGTELYLQSATADSNPMTSEGIHIYFPGIITDINIGDELEIAGDVFEEFALGSELTRTQLRNIKSYKVLSHNNPLPEAVVLGKDGRRIPHEHISTYNGDVRDKRTLKLTDALDFYESLEGMRIEVKDLQIVGFRGGKESSNPFDQKPHLTLYTVNDFAGSNRLRTQSGGILPKPEKDFWNANILTLAYGPMSPHLDSNLAYNVGDKIKGKVQGILHYSKNIFGDGEFSMIVPQRQQAITDFNKKIKSKSRECLDSETLTVAVECRPKVTKPKKEALSIVAYNLKNLSANEELRIEETGKMISNNLACPDIISLVEVQDNNGLDFTGSANADLTLDMIIKAIKCPGKKYIPIVIAPDFHGEGGQPGGNIQLAILYDANKVGFQGNPPINGRQETNILSSGLLTTNPGRVFPNSEAFQRTRRSLVAHFTYSGEDYYVIVNHFNSKLGDSGHWNAIQPVMRNSEFRRARLAYRVNEFVSLIERRVPRANIAVVGDFNAYINEGPMQILEGNVLFNLMRTLPPELRYTTNHNGNSQPLDYIFVNKNLKNKLDKFEVPHLNSNYMGRLSDHDPVHASFLP